MQLRMYRYMHEYIYICAILIVGYISGEYFIIQLASQSD